jgi:hypothetical protein
MERSQVLAALDAILASHRGFGDSDYIHSQMHSVFTYRLKSVASEIPTAGRLLDRLDELDQRQLRRVLGDMVLRCAINHATRRVRLNSPRGLSLDQCSELFEDAANLLEHGYSNAPTRHGAARQEFVAFSSGDSWIWSDEHDDDSYYRAFRELVHGNYGAHICSATDDELAGLRRGTELLRELLPMTADSALSHAHVIGLFPQEGHWKGCGSSSQFGLTGVIFLDRSSLDDPWWVAEHLLHESLHQKLYDFRHGHTLFTPRTNTDEECAIWSPWNSFGNGANRWDVFRAFAAFHVYIHLALLSVVAEQRRSDDAVGIVGQETKHARIITSQTAIDRARYLGHSLGKSCWNRLGTAGKRFHEWLEAVLDVVDSAPPYRGAYVHLLLELYRNEGKRAYSGKGMDKAALASILADDVAATRSILTELGLPSERLGRFSLAILEHENLGDPADSFYRSRMTIADTILELCSDDRKIKPAPGIADPDERVWKIVQNSSERLKQVLDSVGR